MFKVICEMLFVLNIFGFSEMNVSSIDVQLSITIAKNVAKTLQLYAVKCEQLVCRRELL